MASEPINIRWIRTGSQLYWKIMYSIVLQTNFHENWTKKHEIVSSFDSPGLRYLGAHKLVLILLLFIFIIYWKAVYNTIR